MAVPLQSQLQTIIQNPDFLRTDAGRNSLFNTISQLVAPAANNDTLTGSTININVLTPNITTSDVQAQAQTQLQKQAQQQQQQQAIVKADVKKCPQKPKFKKVCKVKKIKVCRKKRVC